MSEKTLSEKQSGIVQIKNKWGKIKDYETVAFRIKKFRDKYPDWTVQTTIIERTEDCVVMRCVIRDAAGRMLATGHGEEFRGSSEVNQTSALENCETSAIGRALAALGFGGTEFASANEVENAIEQQDDLAALKAGMMERLSAAALRGEDALRAAWENSTAKGRRACRDELPKLKALANAVPQEENGNG